MLAKDPVLPVLDLVSAPRGMVAFFNRHVLPAVDSEHEVTQVAIEDMNYTPGKKAWVLFGIAFAGEVPSTWALATFARDNRLEETFARHYVGLATERPVAAVFPEYRCLVELFPFDWKLPSLARAADPAQVGPVLARLTGARPGHPAVSVLRYRPHRRCLLAYGDQADEGALTVIGKVYPEPSEAARVRKRLQDLQAQSADAGLRIPKPLGLSRPLSLLLMERLPGTSMKEIVHAPDLPPITEASLQAAAALAALHSLRLEGATRGRPLSTEWERLRRWIRRLHAVAPELARRFESILDRISTLAPESQPGAPTPVHGDFKPSQLLLEGERVGIVDFDRICLGDPAVDVGNFMAQFHKEAVHEGRDHLRPLADAFLAAYLDCGQATGLESRARLVQSLALVRMAAGHFRRAPHAYADDGDGSSPVLLLDEAETCLAAVPPS